MYNSKVKDLRFQPAEDEMKWKLHIKKTRGEKKINLKGHTHTHTHTHTQNRPIKKKSTATKQKQAKQTSKGEKVQNKYINK